MLMQTIGRVVPASFLSMARQGLFFIPLVIGLPFLVQWCLPEVSPVLGVQLALPLADILTSAAAIPLCVRVMRQHLPVTRDVPE